jgi:hypothetical protein
MTTVADNAPPLDLSSPVRLKEVELGCCGSNVRWITMTLQTTKSITLERVTIRIRSFKAPIAESAYREWQDLDHLLLQFWTSRSIRPKIRYSWEEGGCDLREFAPRLLPELTSRGAIDLVEI